MILFHDVIGRFQTIKSPTFNFFWKSPNLIIFTPYYSALCNKPSLAYCLASCYSFAVPNTPVRIRSQKSSLKHGPSRAANKPMQLEKYSTTPKRIPKGSTLLIMNRIQMNPSAIQVMNANFPNAASLMSTGQCISSPQKSKNAVTLIQITTSSQGTFSEKWYQTTMTLLMESATKDGFTIGAFSTRI